MRLKKNDTVKIIAGKDKGVTGKIIKVDTEKECVYVQGANMVSKAMKKRNQQAICHFGRILLFFSS